MLRFTGVSRYYTVGPERVAALQDVGFTVHSGEALCLVGPSGAGKTTILNLAGLIDRPDAGTVEIAERSVGSLPTSERTELRRRAVGFVFQAFHLLPMLTVFENVAITLEILELPPAEVYARTRDLLAALGIDELAHRRPQQLSAGQRQRVALARAIAKRPSIVLADEPTANLDEAGGETLLDLLLDHCARDQAALIVATHDPRVQERLGRVLRLDHGRITEDRR